jgi:predicted Zn-ribbon and HTH transcriptional regulator
MDENSNISVFQLLALYKQYLGERFMHNVKVAPTNISLSSEDLLRPSEVKEVELVQKELERYFLLGYLTVQHFKCPIGKNFITSPVQFPCGHIFDDANLQDRSKCTICKLDGSARNVDNITSFKQKILGLLPFTNNNTLTLRPPLSSGSKGIIKVDESQLSTKKLFVICFDAAICETCTKKFGKEFNRDAYFERIAVELRFLLDHMKEFPGLYQLSLHRDQRVPPEFIGLMEKLCGDEDASCVELCSKLNDDELRSLFVIGVLKATITSLSSWNQHKMEHFSIFCDSIHIGNPNEIIPTESKKRSVDTSDVNACGAKQTTHKRQKISHPNLDVQHKITQVIIPYILQKQTEAKPAENMKIYACEIEKLGVQFSSLNNKADADFFKHELIKQLEEKTSKKTRITLLTRPSPLVKITYLK